MKFKIAHQNNADRLFWLPRREIQIKNLSGWRNVRHYFGSTCESKDGSQVDPLCCPIGLSTGCVDLPQSRLGRFTDYFLFPKLKAAVRGNWISEIPHIQPNATAEINQIWKKDFQKSFQYLFAPCHACISAAGSYFEGQ